MQHSNKLHIDKVIKELGLSKADLRSIPKITAKPILKKMKDKFTTSQNARWWWECFRPDLPEYSKWGDTFGWRLLEQIVPNKEEKAWFVVDEYNPDIFRLYLGKVSTIQEVIGECPGFEFYIVGTNYDWLVCENHHRYVIAVGDEVVENFEKLVNSSMWNSEALSKDYKAN